MKIKTAKGRSESVEQQAVVRWFRSQYPQYHLIAIPNGQWIAGVRKRKFALINKYKAEGLYPGVSDLFLCVPRGKYAGLWIEMKSKGGKFTSQQREWQLDMLDAGYDARVCYDFEEAKRMIEDYLDGKTN